MERPNKANDRYSQTHCIWNCLEDQFADQHSYFYSKMVSRVPYVSYALEHIVNETVWKDTMAQSASKVTTSKNLFF